MADDVTAVDGLESLSTDDLRKRAFSTAERHLDAGFFWDLLEHLPGAEGMATEDGSSGNVTGWINDVIEVIGGLLGHGYGDAEPLLRARFIDYLRAHGEGQRSRSPET